MADNKEYFEGVDWKALLRDIDLLSPAIRYTHPPNKGGLAKRVTFGASSPDLTSESGLRRVPKSPISPEQFYADLTNPRSHDPDNFCYIVHAVNPHSALSGNYMGGEESDPMQDIDLLRTPHLISRKKKISASIVSDEHMETFGKVFFILDVPWGNILDMAPEDEAIATRTLEEHLASQQLPYMSPRELVRETRYRATKSAWNEILMTGKMGEDEVRNIGAGIIYDRTADGTVYAPAGAEEIRQICSSSGIPLIEFYNDLPKLEEEPVQYLRNLSGDKEVALVTINHGNRRYSFQGSWDEIKFSGASKSDLGITSRGDNPVTKDEYLQVRPKIVDGIETETDRLFVSHIDAHYRINDTSS